MLPSSIRKKIESGETIVCAKSSYCHPEIVELLCTFGFDGIWLCLEHKRIDPAVAYALIQACRLRGVDAIMRIKPSNYTDLLWALETGARGLMLPRVRDVEEVKEVVEAMKFPPMGRRGYDGVQAEARFARMKPADYLKEANRENFLLVQIEEPEILPHLDEVAAQPGVDVLFVGPGDLTLSMGKFGQVDDAEVVDIIRKVGAACQRHGKVAGIPCAPDQVAKYHAMGFRFFNVISDFRCVLNGLNDTVSRLRAGGFPLDEPASH